jgi:hypothetical protein
LLELIQNGINVWVFAITNFKLQAGLSNSGLFATIHCNIEYYGHCKERELILQTRKDGNKFVSNMNIRIFIYVIYVNKLKGVLLIINFSSHNSGTGSTNNHHDVYVSDWKSRKINYEFEIIIDKEYNYKLYKGYEKWWEIFDTFQWLSDWVLLTSRST